MPPSEPHRPYPMPDAWVLEAHEMEADEQKTLPLATAFSAAVAGVLFWVAVVKVLW